MIALSPRYSAAVVALLAVALIAVGLHGAFAARFDPCADPAQLLRLRAYGYDYKISEVQATGDTHPQRRIDGRLPPATPGGERLWFRVSRSEEPYPIYTRSFMIMPLMPEDHVELRELRVGSEVLPVHRVFDDSLGAIRLSRYLVVQGAAPVVHPLTGGIARAWQQLVRGTLPVTVFVVAGVAEDAAGLPALEQAAEAWISAAWSEFRGVCVR